jgi:hypothetical protein
MVTDKIRIYWITTYWTLFLCWLTGAILVMNHFRAGFFTNYLADLTFPAWFYIFIRGLTKNNQILPRLLLVSDWFGKTPERTSISIFVVGTIAELKTIFWPHGILSGTFDPLDILAYAAGLSVCYFFDKLTLNSESIE